MGSTYAAIGLRPGGSRPARGLVVSKALAQLLKSRQLARIRGHNQLAAPAVSDPVLLAEL